MKTRKRVEVVAERSESRASAKRAGEDTQLAEEEVQRAQKNDRNLSPAARRSESRRGCTIGYSDFHNLMGFTSKKMPNNIL